MKMKWRGGNWLLVACPWSSTNSGIQVLAKPRLGGAKLTKLSSALALGLGIQEFFNSSIFKSVNPV
jgi:hypothetical protein